MGQLGYFDHDKRMAALSEEGYPLEAINALGTVGDVPLADRSRGADAAGGENGATRGASGWTRFLKFKPLLLRSLYNLSDEQMEYQVRDRLSFARFLGLRLEDTVPDATSLWLFRETLAKTGLIEKLFDQFGQHLAANGYIAPGGEIVDATIVAVPKQRNDRDESAAIKAGEMPEAWENKPKKPAQRDRAARWTKKHGRNHYGYKNHINVDAKHRLIRRYGVPPLCAARSCADTTPVASCPSRRSGPHNRLANMGLFRAGLFDRQRCFPSGRASRLCLVFVRASLPLTTVPAMCRYRCLSTTAAIIN